MSREWGQGGGSHLNAVSGVGGIRRDGMEGKSPRSDQQSKEGEKM